MPTPARRLLALDEPLHLAILRAHLRRTGRAVLVEAVRIADVGWAGGRVHEIAVPLVRAGRGAPSPLTGASPRIDPRGHGAVPGTPEARWLSASIPTHPELFTEIIAGQLPRLLASLGRPPCWFVRYRSPNESDHLRLRLRVPGGGYGEVAGVVGEWAQRVRDAGLAGGLSFGTYAPEVGRYGTGRAMEAAEAVFVADSRLVVAQARSLPPTVIHPGALAALNMVHIAEGFLGPGAGTDRLADRPVAAAVAERAVADQVVPLARCRSHAELTGWDGEVTTAWRQRAGALAAYRRALPEGADTDAVLEALLHMHHNRAVGLDPDGERVCRRLARQAARARRAVAGGGS